MCESGNSEPMFEGKVFHFFFKSVSHQLYKTADLHLQIRMAGMSTEHYFQSMMDDNNYTL